jgi:hypothetical protein
MTVPEEEKTSPLIGEMREIGEIREENVAAILCGGVPPHKIAATVLPNKSDKSTPVVRSSLKPFPIFNGTVLRDFSFLYPETKIPQHSLSASPFPNFPHFPNQW